MSKTLVFPAQYNRLYNPAKPYGCEESDFGLVGDTLELPLAETALILVDCWSIHYCRSWSERVGRITRERIKPALHAARAAGMTIIHTPAPKIAPRYDHQNPYRQPGDKPFDAILGERDMEWPPAEFLNRTGRYAEFNRDYVIPVEAYEKQYETQDIDENVKPIASDFVINTAGQMQRLLKAKKILHLVYTGFATNMCLHGRDYGVRAMASLGYNPVVLRDCTTAVEFTDTVEREIATLVTIRWMEHVYGYSALSTDFVKACATLKD